MERGMTIATYMTIRAERDAAIQERNMALEERKRAFAERDMAMLQRDAAIAERNSAIQERDEAVDALRIRESSTNDISMIPDSSGNKIMLGTEHMHNQQQMLNLPRLDEAAYSLREISTEDTFQLTEVASETAKPRKVKQPPKDIQSTKSAKSKRVAEDSSTQLTSATSNSWENEIDYGSDEEDPDSQHIQWKDNSGLNQISFDESAMPVPVCSCTGMPQPCYKWGNGGWQSACCTTTMSMYPLPQVSNKRYSRVGGRKMSGSVFTKLFNRLAMEGHDLYTPLDLKDHWAKHGTNRYSSQK